MLRSHRSGALLVLAALATFVALPLNVGGQGDADHPHAAHFEKCAKACTTCMRECESCAFHCAKLVEQGKKEHMTTLGTCIDCSEFCAAAAKIISHNGPMAGLVCESCAKACDRCGKECEKYSSDAHMTRCAKACRDCASECRAMLKHVDQSASAR